MAEPNATSSNIATSSATGSRNGVQIDTNFHGGDGNQQADPTITATSTIVTAINNAATTTTSADDQQWNTHPVYKALSTAAAQRAFLAHATRCAELGSKDKGGIMLPTLSTAVDGNGKLLVLTADPELLYMPCMEEKYGKPKEFVSLSRSFFSEKSKCESLQKIAAVRNLPKSASVIDIEDMMDLQRQIHKQIMSVAKSKTLSLLHKVTNQLNITCGGVQACRIDMVKEEWNNNPSEKLAEQIYWLGWAPREDGSLVSMCFEIIMQLKLWFPVEDGVRDYAPRGTTVAAKKPQLSGLVHEQFRQQVRNKITGSHPPHGISVTISKKNRVGRRKKRFIFAENIKGWNSTKHQGWAASKGEDIHGKQLKIVSSLVLLLF